MNIDQAQIASKTKVGMHEGDPVFRIVTLGGLNMIVKKHKSGKLEVAAAAPHRAIAAFIAEKHLKGVNWSELSKSDSLDPVTIQAALPQWMEITNMFRKADF
jgi:hypothetical protein